MKESKGDIFDYKGKEVDGIIIPTNGVVTSKGNVMGKGLALEAKQRFSDFPIAIGNLISTYGLKVYAWHPPLWNDPWYIAFPTKYVYWEKSDLELIKGGLQTLTELVGTLKLNKIWLPCIGCGLGGLNWEKDVKPLCKEYLNDSFTVIYDR